MRHEVNGAIEHLRKAVELKGATPAALSTLAWILATNSNSAIRNGDEAVKLAEEACRQTNDTAPSALESLAAAYAEVGRFDSAYATAEKAFKLAMAAGLRGQAERINQAAVLYKDHRPFYQ